MLAVAADDNTRDLRSCGVLLSVDWWLLTFQTTSRPPPPDIHGLIGPKMGPISCPETSVTTHLRYITSQKNEDLISTPAEARNHG